jgi:Alkylmercury lyase
MHTSGDAEAQSCCSGAGTTAHTDDSPVRLMSTEEFPATSSAVRAAGFRLLFETGAPVSPTSLAVEAGIDAADLDAALASVRDRGRVEFDENGNLVGIGGLTLTRGRHEFVVNGMSHSTWCALDVVGILGALGATGSVHSTDPHSGEPIEFEYVEGTPTSDVHLFVLSGFEDADVRKDWCPNVNFFASHAGAEAWAAERGLEGDVVAVSTILEDAIAMWNPVVAAESKT